MIDQNLPEMPCRELVEVVTDYLENRLSPADRIRFEAHLAQCEVCRMYWSSSARRFAPSDGCPKSPSRPRLASPFSTHSGAGSHGRRARRAPLTYFNSE